jgi:peroxisomal membrane protein 2
MSSSPAKPSVNPLLVKYLANLATHPLRTKATTSAVLCFLQEVLGSNFAGVPVKKPARNAPLVAHILARGHIDVKAVKMALYGFFVAAPLGHYLVGTLQRVFAGRTGTGARIGQILASNLLIAPIQTTAFLASMAVISGAKTIHEVMRTVQAGFFSVIRVSWVVSPLSMTVAQNFLPVELWVPFFNFIQFVLGTYFNARVKQLRMAAIKRQQEEGDE